MTLEQLKAKFEAWLGMNLVLKNRTEHGAELQGVSPTGIVLFNIMLVKGSGSGWQFGGGSQAMPEDWLTMCKLHR